VQKQPYDDDVTTLCPLRYKFAISFGAVTTHAIVILIHIVPHCNKMNVQAMNVGN
jgi:hypothetical protein